MTGYKASLFRPLMAMDRPTVLLAFVREVANTLTEPQWLPGAPFVGARLLSLAEGR